MALKWLSMNKGERIGAIMLLLLLVVMSVINLSLNKNGTTNVEIDVIKHAAEVTKFKKEISTTIYSNDTISTSITRSKKDTKKMTKERRLRNDNLPKID